MSAPLMPERARSQTIDDGDAIVGAGVAIPLRLLIGGAVVPGFGFGAGREGHDDDALMRRAFYDRLLPIEDMRREVVPCDRPGSFLRINLHLRLIFGPQAGKHDKCSHVLRLSSDFACQALAAKSHSRVRLVKNLAPRPSAAIEALYCGSVIVDRKEIGVAGTLTAIDGNRGSRDHRRFVRSQIDKGECNFVAADGAA